jgi:hypothetical protein
MIERTTKLKPSPPVKSALSAQLQCKAASGSTPSPTSERVKCSKEKGVEHKAAADFEGIEVPQIVHDVLRSPGQPLDSSARAFFEPRFGHDFSKVRVHADTKAGESATQVGAAAYTIGRQVVFAPGRYAPASTEGQALVAHELAHVIQQQTSDSARLIAAPSSAEREAETAAARVLEPTQMNANVSLGRTGLSLAKAPQRGGAKPTTDPVEEARAAAFIRVLLARNRVAGIGPPSPLAPSTGPLAPSPMAGQPYPDIQAYENQQKARRYAGLFFEWENPNMGQVHDILDHMLTALSPGVAVTRAAPGDALCGSRAGYVVNHRLPIVLCPAFFTSGKEQRIRTMIHESAHVAGIGQPQGEGYCAVFDYSGPCPGGFDSADSWAQFVNAVTDQPPDKPQVITPRGSGSGGKKP